MGSLGRLYPSWVLRVLADVFPRWKRCGVVEIFLPPQGSKVLHEERAAFTPLGAGAPGLLCSCEVDDLRTVTEPEGKQMEKL